MDLLRAVKQDPSRTEELTMAVDLYLSAFTTPGIELELLSCLDLVPNGVDIYEMVESALESEEDGKRVKALRTIRNKNRLCLPREEYAVAYAGHPPQNQAYGSPARPSTAPPYGAQAYGAPAYGNGYWQGDGGMPPVPPAHSYPANQQSGVYPLPTHVTHQSGVHPMPGAYGSYGAPWEGRGPNVSTGNHPALNRGRGPTQQSGVHPIPQGGRGWPTGSYAEVEDGYPPAPAGRYPSGVYSPVASDVAAPWATGPTGAPSYSRPAPIAGVLSRQEIAPESRRPVPVASRPTPAFHDPYDTLPPVYEHAAASVDASAEALYDPRRNTPVQGAASVPASALEELYEAPISRRETATTGMFTSLTDYLDQQGASISVEIDRRRKRRLAIIGAVAVVIVAAILAIWP